VKKLHAIWLFGIVASIGLTTMVSGNPVIAQYKYDFASKVENRKALEFRLM
jgi:hypothetical protein